MSAENPQELILLVGSNPLPNYIAARMLGIKNIRLVYTDQTIYPKERLKRCLTKNGFSCTDLMCIGDAAHAPNIRNMARDSLPARAHLHYTGGTKTMVAHIYEEWKKKAGEYANASYLDDRTERLRFANGEDKSIDIDVELQTLVELHGLTDFLYREQTEGEEKELVPRKKKREDEPTREDVRTLAKQVFSNPHLATELYQKMGGEGAKVEEIKKRSFNLHSLTCVSLSQEIVGGSGWNEKRFKPWWRFLKGDWFEDWVAEQVAPCTDLYSSIATGVTAKSVKSKKAREFEVDVVVIRKQRLYLISCTTENRNDSIGKGLCKSKLFEVAMRARQLGGDLARAALVCLIEKNVAELEEEVQEAWDSQSGLRVFGLEHVREWAQYEGDPKRHSLLQWLEK